MDYKLNIKGAFSYAIYNGNVNIEEEFAKEEWPEADKAKRYRNLYNLKKGVTKPKFKTIIRICQKTGVDPNYIFNWEK